MTAFIIITIVIALAWFLFSGTKKKETEIPTVQSTNDTKEDKNTDQEDEIFTDEKGKYRIVDKTRELPRKTYLLGTLYGKYWGEIDPEKEEEFQYSKFYDFHIYESDVSNSEISQTAFEFIPDSRFPRERLPQLLPILLKRDGKEYAINIYEPQLAGVKFISRLHQTDGKEVFGTIEARITGYLLDFIAEKYQEKEYLQNEKTGIPIPAQAPAEPTETLVPTGNVEYKDGYKRIEYYYSNYRTKYWGRWRYSRPIKTTSTEGCLSSGLGIIGTIIGITFLLLLLPRLVFLLPFFLIAFIFRVIPFAAWVWIFRIVGGFLLIAFIVSLINILNHSTRTYIPKPIVQDKPEERKPEYNPITDTTTTTTIPDTLITHYRTWQDYSGNHYEGKFWIRKSALASAHNYKNNLSLVENNERSYDEIIFRLKENDKNSLQGIYHLFDSLKAASNLSTSGMAEMIVSFVQDIPYCVVLSNACDPSLYADDFIRNYLLSPDARCDGYEKFGINTPVEFMATLLGDCDTRTLLVYTFLSHYGYDVALLSSEYYNHSIIGVNLPYDGVSYKYNTERYVLWETTAPNIKPGVLPNEISNINYWRISLKSK